MTKLNEIYKCEICGNIVELLHTGIGQLVCCGQNMNLQEPQIKEGLGEKHLPVVKNIDGKIKVTVGEVLHPMTKEHYIEWIELIKNNKVYKEFLSPEDKPETIFNINDYDEIRAYCNLHKLWQITKN
jgi:superoxide reductase